MLGTDQSNEKKLFWDAKRVCWSVATVLGSKTKAIADPFLTEKTRDGLGNQTAAVTLGCWQCVKVMRRSVSLTDFIFSGLR